MSSSAAYARAPYGSIAQIKAHMGDGIQREGHCARIRDRNGEDVVLDALNDKYGCPAPK